MRGIKPLEYIQIAVDVLENRKTKRLAVILKCDIDFAFMRIFRLLLHLGKKRPDGKLDGYNSEDLSLITEYNGDPMVLEDALIRSSWIAV